MIQFLHFAAKSFLIDVKLFFTMLEFMALQNLTQSNFYSSLNAMFINFRAFDLIIRYIKIHKKISQIITWSVMTSYQIRKQHIFFILEKHFDKMIADFNECNIKLKLSQVPNYKELKVLNPKQKPYRFICYIKINIQHIESKISKVKYRGSGVRIDKRYVLTVAHNVYAYVNTLNEIENTKSMNKYRDDSYIKQGLNDDEHLAQFKIKKIHISKHYSQKHKKMDYALIQIQPLNPEQNKQIKQAYPAVLSLDTQYHQLVQTIYVFGYPTQANKLEYEGKDLNGKSIIKDMYGAKGAPQQITSLQVTYKIPTEKGTSGTAIFANCLKIKEYVVIGIHKGSTLPEQLHNQKAQKKPDQQYYNFGTCCELMMQELNAIGYEQNKKPFVFTLKTLILRQLQQKLPIMQNLVLKRHNFYPKDILVLTSFDLSKITRIQLTYNNFGNDGVKLLLRKNYPNLHSLYLNQNKITSLEELSKEHWEHIQNLSTFSLTSNSLSNLPQHFLLLKNLEKFFLTFNLFEDIPDILMKYCIQNKETKRVIHFYEHKHPKYKENIANIAEQSKKINSQTRTTFHIYLPQKEQIKHFQ